MLGSIFRKQPNAVGSPAVDDANRAIRVFVSSTFRDMVEEREELAKRVFPSLRRICDARGVAFTDVDLRWGVTEEDAAEGRVLPVCLEEIERSRPYFIGVLGERYGWVPDAVPEELLESQPWIRENAGRSITDLEIIHGVLRDSEMAGYAFFYFRDPKFVEALPEEVRKDYTEGSVESRAKLEELKQRIRASRMPLHEGYGSPQDFAALVLSDLSSVIDRLYPPEAVLDPVEREKEEHAAYARERAAHYLGRPEYFEQLDDYLEFGGQPIVVTGDSGAGKSALLSAWLRGDSVATQVNSGTRRRSANTGLLAFSHFVGLTIRSTNEEAVCRRAIAEIVRATSVIISPRSSSAEMDDAFAETLAAAAAETRILLVVDGLDRLEHDGSLLEWLPRELPDNVRVVVSSLPGVALDEVSSRGFREVAIQPLTAGESASLIRDYLGTFGKSLSDVRASRIIASPHSHNPLFLRTLLDELRLWGEHERLDEALAEYLRAETVDDLFELVFARWERDYEEMRPGLVRDTARAIWASRRGLQESEVLALLGKDGEPLPRASFGPLQIAASGIFPVRQGRMTFAHDYVRIAVEDRYLTDIETRRRSHERLAAYFRTCELTSRSVEEIPHQLAAIEDWTGLAEVLAAPEFFRLSWEEGREDTLKYWRRLIEELHASPVFVYAKHLNDPAGDVDLAEHAVDLLDALGLEKEAAAPAHMLAEHLLSTNHGARAAGLMIEQARRVRSWDAGQASSSLTSAESIYRRLGDLPGMIMATWTRVDVELEGDDPERALHYCRLLGALARMLGIDGLILRQAYAGMVECFARLGDEEKAQLARAEVLRIDRGTGGAQLGISLVKDAKGLVQRGEYERAVERLSEAIQRFRVSQNLAGLEWSLWVLAEAHEASGSEEAARACREESAQLAAKRQQSRESLAASTDPVGFGIRRVRDLRSSEEYETALQELDSMMANIEAQEGCPHLAEAMIIRGSLLSHLMRHEEALESYRSAADLGDGVTPNQRAWALRRHGVVSRALKLHEEAVRSLIASAASYESVDKSIEAAESFRLAGLSQEALGRKVVALGFYRRAESLLEAVPASGDLACVIRFQGVVLGEMEAFGEAMDALERAQRLYREHEELKGLAITLSAQGALLRKMDDPAGAAVHFAEAESLFEQLKLPRRSASAARKLAWALRETDDFAAGEGAARRAIEGAVAAGDNPGLAAAYRVLAVVLRDGGSHGDAIVAFRDAIAVASECAAHVDLYWSLIGLAQLLRSESAVDEARDAARRAVQLAREQNWNQREKRAEVVLRTVEEDS